MNLETRTGLRSIALFEAGKGLLAILAGIGVLFLLHRDLREVGESICSTLHLDPTRHYPSVFIDSLGRVQNQNLTLLALGAFAYALLREVEAYGLWYARPWAEWLAIVSGGIYLPVELYELYHAPSIFKLVITIFNILLVIFLLTIRFGRHQNEQLPPPEAE